MDKPKCYDCHRERPPEKVYDRDRWSKQLNDPIKIRCPICTDILVYEHERRIDWD